MLAPRAWEEDEEDGLVLPWWRGLGVSMPHVLKVPSTCPSCQQFSLASPFVAPTSTDTPSMTTEAPCGEGWAPDNPMDTPEHLNLLGLHLGSSLLGATLLDE